jgi:hypothetical protein
MNRQIIKLFGFLLILYALLFGFTSYWSVFDSDSLKANQANRRPLLEEQTIKRGNILAADGSVIAHSRATGKGNNKIYVRHYPQGGLFWQPDRLQLRDAGPGRLRALPTTSWSAQRPSSSPFSMSSRVTPRKATMCSLRSIRPRRRRR